MGFRIITAPKVVLADKELATKYSNMRTIVHDRALRPHRLNHYRKEWAAGEFTPVTWATCRCLETGLDYRVNGKHTSTLLCQLDVIPKFYVILEHFEADTMQDVVSLYTKFDPGIASKNTGDVNKVYAGSIPELANVPNRIVTVCITGINYAVYGDRAWDPQPEGRAKVLLTPENTEFIIWADTLLGGKHSTLARPMRKCGLTATMSLSYKLDREDTDLFWTAVRDETGTNPKYPDRVLAKFINTHITDMGGGAKTKRPSQAATYRQFHVVSIMAWNAWRTDTLTKLKYNPDDPIPALV